LQHYKSPLWYLFFGKRYQNLKNLLFILTANFFTAALEGASFALIMGAFSSLEGTSVIPFIGKYTIPLSSIGAFHYLILAAIGAQALRSLTAYLALFATAHISLKIQQEAQERVYQQILRFSYPFVSRYNLGDLNEHIRNPSIAIPAFFNSFSPFLTSLSMVIALVAVLSWISLSLTALTAALFLLFIFLQKTFIRKVKEHSIYLTQHLFEFSHQTVQSLQGLKAIYIFNQQKFILQKTSQLLTSIAQSSKKVMLWNNLTPSINETINILLVGTILIAGSFLLAREGQMTISQLLTYVALTYRLATRLQHTMTGLSQVITNYGSLLKLNKILDNQDKEFTPPNRIPTLSWNTKLELQNAVLHYPNTNKPALNNVTFSIAKGSVTGIVGLSGAGKSSLLDVILGLYPLSQGKVLIDNQDLSLFTPASWLDKIGVVTQDTFLFNDTILENIRFSNPSASLEQIKNACELAGALSFIERLPNQFQTIIGERGYRLSGGEKQRLALARALVKNPEILVLDEATSNLDSHSEKWIQDSLRELQTHKTILIVAHRLSTIACADQIIVMHQGEIIEKGTHEELLKKNGQYASMWEIQSKIPVGA
jgi:subfamily B ATP-binding cassette protein MsbA